MRAVRGLAQIFFPSLLLIASGCEPAVRNIPAPTGDGSDSLPAYASYAAAKVDIVPLTRFAGGGAAEGESELRVYVSLRDSFDCQMKWPGVFRFELYELIERSPEPKGKRVAMWTDVDLTDAGENNGYWRDYLRAYEFRFAFEPQVKHDYILEVTCRRANGVRLSDEFVVRYKK